MPEESEDGTREDAVELENDQEGLLEDDVAKIDEDDAEDVSTLSARASEDPDTGPQEQDGVVDDADSPSPGLRGPLNERAEESPSIPDDTPSIQVCSTPNSYRSETNIIRAQFSPLLEVQHKYLSSDLAQDHPAAHSTDVFNPACPHLPSTLPAPSLPVSSIPTLANPRSRVRSFKIVQILTPRQHHGTLYDGTS